MLTKSSLRLKILLVLAIIIVLNFLFSQFFVRLDFTGDKRYTLSQATKDILSNLEEPVTVTAYFSENLPPQLKSLKTDFRDMLVEYANRSNGNVVYEFVDPNESDEIERSVIQEGIRTISINMRERDQMKQQRAYMGAKLQYGDQTEVIPYLEQGAGMEYALSSSIKKISVANKPKIGLISGYGAEGKAAIMQAMEELSILYQVEDVSLGDSSLLTDYKTLAFLAPKDSMKQSDFDQLDAFLGTGKGLLIAANRANADMQTATASAISTGLEVWLADKGLRLNEDLVVDANCGAVSVQEQQSFFTFNRQIQFPFLPIIQKFADHSITKGLEQVILPFASSLTFTEKADIQFTPLMTTSDRSGIQDLPVTFDVKKEWKDKDFPTSKVTVAGILEGKLTGTTNAKMVVFGDGDFAVNGAGERPQPVQPDNVSLFVNAIDFLSDDTGLTELRTKGVTARPIQKELTDNEKQVVKFGNFLLPIILIILFGIIRSQFRKAKKMRWASERW